MIRVTTDRAIDATLRRHATVLATQYADAIETLLPLPCDHRDRLRCPKCAERRAVFAAASIVRETGAAT